MNLENYEELYQCFNRMSCGIIGRNEDWVIIRGSKIACEDTCSYAEKGRIQRLVEEGYIRNNIFVKDYPVKSKAAAVTIIGRHGVSNEDAEKKSCSISKEEAVIVLENNMKSLSEGDNSNDAKVLEREQTINMRTGFDLYEELITDANFQKLKYMQKEINIFNIVGQTHTEHWHSSFLKWLFEPVSSLNLGHFPLERLLYLYIIKRENSCISYDDIENMNLDEIDFCTEKSINTSCFHGWNKGAIDVYGESKELIIVIENKVTVKEEVREGNVGQTELYYNYVEKNKSKGQKSIYLFITPDPTQKPCCDEYVQITYQEIYDSIISKCIINPEINEGARYVLQQYANNLRSPYKKDNKKYPMALIHIAACERLYEMYTELLDRIFLAIKERKISSLEFSIYKKYKEVFDEIYMSVEKYGRTPDLEIERKMITFDNLVNLGRISENTFFYMNYDGVVYNAKLIKNSNLKEWCMAILDEKGDFYVDENGTILEQYCAYRTPSRAAGDAVYLYRTKRGDMREKPSLNGRDYWIVCGDEVKLSSLMN